MGRENTNLQGADMFSQNCSVNTLGSLLIPHSVRLVLLMIPPYRLFPTLTVSTHPFPETKGCQVEFLGEEMEEEGLEMGMECGLQSIKAKQEGWKRE